MKSAGSLISYQHFLQALPDLLQCALLQPGDLGLGDAHLGGDLHLGLALEKA